MKVEAEAKNGVEVDGDGLAHLKSKEEEGTYFPTTVMPMWGVFVWCERGYEFWGEVASFFSNCWFPKSSQRLGPYRQANSWTSTFNIHAKFLFIAAQHTQSIRIKTHTSSILTCTNVHQKTLLSMKISKSNGNPDNSCLKKGHWPNLYFLWHDM